MGDVNCAFFSLMQGCFLLALSLHNIRIFNRGLISVKKVLSVIERKPAIPLDSQDYEDLEKIDSDIHFENVSFAYPSSSEVVIKNVSFTIEKGKTTAIVGPSGSGKSTLVKLLERFYDPSEGQVVVNNKNLKCLYLRRFRHRVGYVGQEPSLMNETIRENMLNANPSATEEDINKALTIAEAYDFVSKLSEGIDTHVGAVGSKLSGGQKQRLAIARALVKKPDLLIFDEATSALDSENEEKVQKAIESVSKINITKVMIAHRLSTIKNADKIIVMKEGEIEEQGTHDELLEAKGLYASLINIQETANKIFEWNNFAYLNENWMAETFEHGNIIYDQDCENSNLIERKDSSLSSSHNENSIRILSDNNEIPNLGTYDIFKRLYVYNKPKWYIPIVVLGLGVVASTFIATVILQNQVMMSYVGYDYDTMKKKMIIFLPQLLIIAVIILIITGLAKYCTFYLTSNMVMALRIKLYGNIAKQPAEFFDKRINSTGNLMNALSEDIRYVNGASVESYSMLFQGLIGMITAIIISVCYNWKVGLISTCLIPLISIWMYYQASTQFYKDSGEMAHSNQATIISDCISNHSTVASLSNEDTLIRRYFTLPSLCQDIKRLMWLSLTYATVCSSIFLMFFFLYTALISEVENGKGYKDVFISVFVSIWGWFTLANVSLNAPELAKGRRAASKILYYEALTKEEDDGFEEITEEIASGDVQFHNVYFRYPSAVGNKWTLKNFNLIIRSGESIGIVGESGCGKSTILQLLSRFYEPQRGYITIDGIPIKRFTLRSLRSRFAIVQQEPILFNMSILDNIRYGKPEATSSQIKEAALTANAVEFIEKDDLINDAESSDELASIETDATYYDLHKGYRIIWGPKGQRLSGGQKQRIAIARAIVRDPSILMFDEATAALDEHSQQVVQEALEGIMQRWTCIVIAHRPSALSKWDRIIRISDGVALENY
jgi:ATP-binding cassette, subfamily B (MDR/TAP), member 1